MLENKNEGFKRRHSNCYKKHPSQLWFWSLTLLLVLCHILTPGHCFFFPKSLFRRLSSSPPSPAQSAQNSPVHETLIASEQQIQPGVRIINRPNPFQNQQQKPQPNPNFHVPKALCIACERFPWMPVAGLDKPNGGGQQSQPSQQQSQQLPNGNDGQPTKTIVISALGEAKGPVPIPHQQANRKPFAIQFDSTKSQNNVQAETKPAPGGYTQNNNDIKNTDPATRPISFQIYDPPRQPTVLQPVGNPPSKPQGQPQEPSAFMQPPSTGGFQFQQVQHNGFRPDFRMQSMSFGRPTVLRPVNAVYFPSQQNNGFGPLPQQNNNGYGPPLAQNNNGLVPPPQQNNVGFGPPPQQNTGFGPPPQQNNGFGPPPQQNNNVYRPPQTQNNNGFVPPPPPQNNGYAPNNGYGPPPRNQGKTPQQSVGNFAPIPPITISTIVAAQHGRPQNGGQLPEFQAIQPAKLVYQEHTQIHGPSIAPYKNQPPIQYGKPFTPPPQPPQNIKLPILPRPFGPSIFPNKNERPQGQYGTPSNSGQNGPPPGSYLPPPPQPQSRPPPGSYLPPQSQQGNSQRPIGNQQIANLRPPPSQGGYSPPQVQNPQGQVFFPPPQATIQYGAPRPQNAPNQAGESQQPSNSIPNLVKSQNSNDVNQRQQNSRPQTNPQHSPVPNTHLPVESSSTDYHQSGSNNLNQHESPSSNAIQSHNKVTFSPPKGVVKNPHIQSIENVNPSIPSKESHQQSLAPLTQESGWEIIPAVQTDITHLFQNPQPTRPIEQPKQVTVPVPLPVPIPIPESHASKSPIFIVRGQGSGQSNQADGQQQNTNIFVQGVTYHEENRNNGGEERTPPAAQSQTQPAIVTVPPTYQYQTQIPDTPPPPVSIPIVQPQIILRPHPGHQFDPLPASISTALYHAQRTSYLTHQYLSQSGGAGGGQNNGGRTVYVHSVPVQQEPQQSGPSPSSYTENNNYITSESNTNKPTQILEEEPSGKGDGVSNDNNVGDQTPVNCQNHQQWVTSANNHIQEQKTEEEQSSPAAPTSTPQNEQKPYLIYYPTPAQQSSIYWVQPPRNSQGFLRLRPQAQPPTEGEIKESSNAVVFTPPVPEWSKIVTQSHTVSENQKQNTDDENNGHTQDESYEANRDTDEYSFKIPFGQKLPKRTTVTPFDIISVDSKDEPADETHVQSLEEDSSQSQDGNHQNLYQSSESSSSSSQDGNKNDDQNHLNDFSSGSVGQDDLESRPGGGGTILRPVTTTIIHSPDATSFAAQSFRYPSFKPQKVIVHDFTKGGSGVTSLIEDQEEQQQEDRTVGEQSQNVQSWRAFNNNRPKSPKLVENYPVNDSEEEKQFLTSVSNNKVVQSYQNPVEIASGTVSVAECATAHTEPITVTTVSTEENPHTFSTGNLAENFGKNGGKEKVRLRVGARFPAGRPSLTSFNAWTVTTTTPVSIPVEYDQSFSEDNDSQNPGSYSASISIPVYRPPNAAREIQNQIGSSPNSFSPPNNLLILDDIYKNSELKQHSLQSVSSTSTEDHGSQAATEADSFVTMSTEKSSSFSISEDESGMMTEGQSVELDSNSPRKVAHSTDGQKIEIRESQSSFSSQSLGQSVHIVTSAPVVSSSAYELTTTTTPSPASTSTKIVKTVRVRQRMRPGGGGGNFNGTIRSRFNGPGRIRVVQRPVTPEYVKHFPEFASPESEKLAKEEEEEVKNALIELKRSERAKA